MIVRLIATFILFLALSVCWADVISDLRPCIQATATANQLDPILMEAIIRCESANGQSKAAKNKNNLAGIMGRRHLKRFGTKEECIADLGHILVVYRSRGLTSVERIAKRYAPYHRSKWTRLINLYMDHIKAGKWGKLD